MQSIENFEATFQRLQTYLTSLAIIVILYQLSVYFYNAYFHPLSKFPGPKLAAVSNLPYIIESLRGNNLNWILELHKKYGDVVRFTPTDLTFSAGESWKDIYGHKQAGIPTLAKDKNFYGEGRKIDIVNSNNADHSRMRRVFSHAFSDKALKLQEPLFLTYVNTLIQKLKSEISKNPDQKFDMVRMLNFTTFDIMGDLTFGEPLGMLENSDYHPWVSNMFANFRFGTYLHCSRYYPLLTKLLMRMVPKSLLKEAETNERLSAERVDRRIAKKDARPDIWGLVLNRDEDSGLSKQEMYSNAGLFMIAGTETTATLLSGLIYYLLRSPEKLKTLTDEIRSAFLTEEDITMEGLQRLKYMFGCIEEGLRMYPPVANGLPRVIPPSGVRICNHEVPGGAIVRATNIAVYRDANNFKDPYSFLPERWISEEFASDKKFALQPFSVGPRNCLGKNMAYHEIRIILAKVLYNFDLKLCSDSQNWSDQKNYIMWDKSPLICQLSTVKS